MDLLLTLANQREMAPSGEIFADDEASTFKEMEALRVPGQWTKLAKMWSAQRHAGILLLASNSVRYQLLPVRAVNMQSLSWIFFCPWDCSALSHLGGLSALRNRRAEEPRDS